jgi:predicted nucleic acid-binding protein
MKRYADVPMDLADACLVHMADVLGKGTILTLDGDFKIFRWRRRRAFDLLIPLG